MPPAVEFPEIHEFGPRNPNPWNSRNPSGDKPRNREIHEFGGFGGKFPKSTKSLKKPPEKQIPGIPEI
jgi:hypothetical protein